jgi:peroxiredoxin
MRSWKYSLICRNGLVALFNRLIESAKNTALASYVGEHRVRSAEGRVG